MGKSKKCNCDCRCKSFDTPLRTNVARVFAKSDRLDNVNIFPVFVNFPPRQVGPRSSFSGYPSGLGLVDGAVGNPGASILNPTATDKYGVL